MERYMRQEARQAHRQEIRNERQEAKLHNQAIRAAAHGNIGTAISLEMQSKAAHNRAEMAHDRKVAARQTANAIHHHHHPHPPPLGPMHPHYPRPHTDVHVVHHYPAPAASYPVGTAPPPAPAAGYPPNPAYPQNPSYPAYPGAPPHYR